MARMQTPTHFSSYSTWTVPGPALVTLVRQGGIDLRGPQAVWIKDPTGRESKY